MKQKVLLLLMAALFLASCSDNDKTNELPFCQAYITSYNEFGAAMLNLTQADMTEAGFSLDYLLTHGMTPQQLDDLVQALTESH